MSNADVVGSLVGFSIAALIIPLVISILMYVLMFWMTKKALNNLGIGVTGLIFIPIVGTYHMAQKMDYNGKYRLFGAAIPSALPKFFPLLAGVSVLIPFVGPLIMIVLMILGGGALYTRIWDIADGKADGESSVLGACSALIGIIFFIRMVLIAFSTPEHSYDEFVARNLASAPQVPPVQPVQQQVQQSVQPVQQQAPVQPPVQPVQQQASAQRSFQQPPVQQQVPHFQQQTSVQQQQVLHFQQQPVHRQSVQPRQVVTDSSDSIFL